MKKKAMKKTAMKKKAVRSAAEPGEPTPVKWIIVLHVVNGKVEAQREWWRQMKVGDLVYFRSPDGVAEVKFKPLDAKDQSGRLVRKYPFGKENIFVRGATRAPFKVVNSCKAVMSCSIVRPDKSRVTYEKVIRGAAATRWKKAKVESDEAGSNVCTGGTGNSTVKC